MVPVTASSCRVRAVTNISVILLSLSLASAWACGVPPTTPSPATSVATPPETAITALRISGPTTIAPGATGHYMATADRADGSSQDVTAMASWNVPVTTTNLRITGAGTVQAGTNQGETVVGATLFGIRASLPVLILEPGTFRVSGSVTETDGWPISGASIQVVSGTGTGQQSRSDSSGKYAIYGVAAAVALRVTASGHAQQDQSIVVADQMSDDFTLTQITAPIDLSGAWTLTLSASPECRATLPEVARERQYEAVITQEHSDVVVTLSGPTIEVLAGPAGGPGRVIDQTLSFGIMGDTGYGDWVYPSFGDRLSATESLGVTGDVHGTVAGSEIRATMDGYIEYWKIPSPIGKPAVVCKATDHEVVLRRR